MASIKNLGDGKFRIFICNGFKPDGKLNRISKVIMAKSERDAEKQAQALEVHFKESSLSRVENEEKVEPDNQDITFRQLVDQWKELKAGDLVEKTRNRYEDILKNSMLPVFGDCRLMDIRAIDIDRYLSSLRQEGARKDGKPGGYSQKTILNYYVLLHKLFNEAVRWDMVSQNVCDKVTRPKLDKKEAHCYEEDQIKEMLKCLEQEDDVYKAYVLIALTSACRRSEVLGLEWDDLDFANNLIKIRRTSHYSVKKGVYTQEKTKNGDPGRIITMPPEVMEFLKKYKAEQEAKRLSMGDKWISCERLFVSETGGNVTPAGSAILPDNISQWFERFLAKNHLPSITLHQVRHTSISYLINNGMDLKTVSQRAGHKDISTTAMIYGHLFEKTKRECADKFSDLLSCEKE